MFGRTKKRAKPADSPFPHGDRCRTPDATPEWIDEGEGRWVRTCSCDAQYWYEPTATRDEHEASPALHRHDPGCEMTAVVREYPDGSKYTFCHLCGTYTHTWAIPRMHPDDQLEYLAGYGAALGVYVGYGPASAA